MNPLLDKLQPYPFEKLRSLFAQVSAPKGFSAISLGIGEPKHATPEFIRRALADNLDGLASYPATAGLPALREAIAAWLMQRYGLTAIDPATQVLPVNGSREALFAIAQTVVDPSRPAVVICPNPFYQIYEGAALLSGAEPYFVNADPALDFRVNYAEVPEAVWKRTQLVYACSPGNPTGNVMSLDEWRILFELSDRHGFVIASDECYSELYYDEANPPLGALQAAQLLGRSRFERLIVFSSLSKRSNVPGMRSGFVAGDAALMKQFLLYRTYQGGAMNPAVQVASTAAWKDEGHVRENRRLYAEKFSALLPLLSALGAKMPAGGFYLWLRTPIADDRFARELYRDYNVTVLPGSYLAREAAGGNPGKDRIRIALVAPLAECREAVERLRQFTLSF
ncbi:MAG: succinyldiaminopimelate transaminase [Betaproteobacteria bacterium]